METDKYYHSFKINTNKSSRNLHKRKTNGPLTASSFCTSGGWTKETAVSFPPQTPEHGMILKKTIFHGILSYSEICEGHDNTGVYRLRYPYVSLTCITAGPAPGIPTNDQGLRLKRRKRSSFASPPSNMFWFFIKGICFLKAFVPYRTKHGNSIFQFCVHHRSGCPDLWLDRNKRLSSAVQPKVPGTLWPWFLRRLYGADQCPILIRKGCFFTIVLSTCQSLPPVWLRSLYLIFGVGNNAIG